jgi:hypothetical protein
MQRRTEMTQRHKTPVAMLVLAMAAAVFAAAAVAGPPVRDTIHVEETVVDPDFCGVGLNAEVDLVMDIRVHAVPHGRDRLVYFLQHGTRTDVVTNLANGNSVTAVASVVEKDKRVTDNGDGTLTILILATGNAVLYGPDGKAIARDPGQIRFELVVDHGGTPNDPSDDAELDFRIVKESTGRSDDFCTAAVGALS